MLRPKYVLLLLTTSIRHKIIVVQLSIVILLSVTCSSALHTHRIVAFLLQQWLNESATMLRYTYIVCRVVV